MYFQDRSQIRCSPCTYHQTTCLIAQNYSNQIKILPKTENRSDPAVNRMLFWFFSDQGSSRIEPGRTPRANMTLTFYTWSEFEKNCGYSRLYGGVNFPDSINNVKNMAAQMGRRAIDFVRYHVNLNSKKEEKQSYKSKKHDNSYTLYSRGRSQRRIMTDDEIMNLIDTYGHILQKYNAGEI